MIDLNLIDPEKLGYFLDRLEIDLNPGDDWVVRLVVHKLRIPYRGDSVDFPDPFLEMVLLKLIPESLGLIFAQVIFQRESHY
jgi:hypothetical protein